MKSRKTVFGLGRMAGWAAALGCWLASSLAMALSPWVTLKNCTLETSWEGNDGDSFLVKCPDLKPEKDILKVLRLYYVDTPESEDSLPERLEVQREYWDLPNVQTVVKCGIKAKQFTKHFLAGGFEVHTRWETALGRTKMGRHYALLYLMVPGSKQRSLGTICPARSPETRATQVTRSRREQGYSLPLFFLSDLSCHHKTRFFSDNTHISSTWGKVVYHRWTTCLVLDADHTPAFSSWLLFKKVLMTPLCKQEKLAGHCEVRDCKYIYSDTNRHFVLERYGVLSTESENLRSPGGLGSQVTSTVHTRI